MDSESMPPETFLLHPPSGDITARQCKLLYDTALSLTGRMTVELLTSKILEAQLDAIHFLGSDKHPPGQKLHEKLGLITRMQGTV
jgi:hypothetical protein